MFFTDLNILTVEIAKDLFIRREADVYTVDHQISSIDIHQEEELLKNSQ
jgi:hypothetical protein